MTLTLSDIPETISVYTSDAATSHLGYIRIRTNNRFVRHMSPPSFDPRSLFLKASWSLNVDSGHCRSLHLDPPLLMPQTDSGNPPHLYPSSFFAPRSTDRQCLINTFVAARPYSFTFLTGVWTPHKAQSGREQAKEFLWSRGPAGQNVRQLDESDTIGQRR